MTWSILEEGADGCQRDAVRKRGDGRRGGRKCGDRRHGGRKRRRSRRSDETKDSMAERGKKCDGRI